MSKSIAILILGLFLALPQLAVAAPVVLFDEGHAQQFKIGGDQPLDLSGLAAAFTRAGYEIRTTTQALDATALTGIDALVISGPFQAIRADEVAAIQAFLTRGGALAVMLHIAPPADALLQALEVAFSNGIISEKANIIGDNPQDFKVIDLAKHPLTAGLSDFALYGAWALQPTAAVSEVLAKTSNHSFVDLNRDRTYNTGDAMQPFAVLVAGTHREGRYAVFGDDAIFQNRFLEGSNRQLADNLARWLAAPSKPKQAE
jgi:hypothetical protein